MLRYRCHRVKAKLTRAHLVLQRVSPGCTPCHLPLTGATTVRALVPSVLPSCSLVTLRAWCAVPYEEILSARAVETPARLSVCCSPQASAGQAKAACSQPCKALCSTTGLADVEAGHLHGQAEAHNGLQVAQAAHLPRLPGMYHANCSRCQAVDAKSA